MNPDGTPEKTTKALFLGAFWHIIGYTVLGLFVSELLMGGRMTPGFNVTMGVMFAVWNIRDKYRKPEWRVHVAPDQILGLGLAVVVLVLAATVYVWPTPALANLRWFLFIGMTFLAWPGLVLVRLSVREIRRRRNGDLIDRRSN